MRYPTHIYLDLDAIKNNYNQSGSPLICDLMRLGTRPFWTVAAPNTFVL